MKARMLSRPAGYIALFQNTLQEDVVHDIIRRAVQVERKSTCEALSCDLTGMNDHASEVFFQAAIQSEYSTD